MYRVLFYFHLKVIVGLDVKVFEDWFNDNDNSIFSCKI